MPNNGSGRNRGREGSFRDWNDSGNRYGRNRSSGYENDVNRGNEGNYGSRGGGSYSTNYGQGSSPYGQGGGRYGRYDYNDEGYMGDSNYDRSRGRFGSSSGMNRGSSYSDRGYNDWNRGSRGYMGSGYGGYNERYNEGRDRDNDRGWWDRTKDEVSSWFGDEEAQRRRDMDEREGQFKGKGPKGYTRSDDRIKEDVNDRLSDDSQVDASEIDVTVNNSDVTLTGTVNTRWEKRRAEDVAEFVSGVKNVENRLRVTSSTFSQGSETSGSGSMNKGNGKTEPGYSGGTSATTFEKGIR